MSTPIQEYERRYKSFLREIAHALREHLISHLKEVPNIDHVTARAKSPARFAEKAQRLDKNGKRTYTKPLTEIQDQVGVRVIVFYLNDVEPVGAEITKYLRPIEEKELVPESQWEFGYFGKHYVLPLPRDVVPKEINLADTPRFFELQIKTLFQHAWSEANHDLGYKSHARLSPDQQRRLAFTAAQAWGADRIFEELRSELQSS